jgi:hypothetical protein
MNWLKIVAVPAITRGRCQGSGAYKKWFYGAGLMQNPIPDSRSFFIPHYRGAMGKKGAIKRAKRYIIRSKMQTLG